MIIAGCLALLLAGYASGRRVGIVEGRRRGEREAILSLRDQAYTDGICPLCGDHQRWLPK